MNRPKTSSATQNRGSLPRLVRAFRVQGDLTDKTLDELCDEIETLAHEMRQAKHIRHATIIMHLAADAVVTYSANEKVMPRRPASGVESTQPANGAALASADGSTL